MLFYAEDSRFQALRGGVAVIIIGLVKTKAVHAATDVTAKVYFFLKQERKKYRTVPCMKLSGISGSLQQQQHRIGREGLPVHSVGGRQPHGVAGVQQPP